MPPQANSNQEPTSNKTDNTPGYPSSQPQAARSPGLPTASFSSLISNNRSFSKKTILIFVAVFVLIGVYFSLHSFAATPLVASMEAETMTLPAGGSIISDTNASGGKAVRLLSNGTATGSVTLPTEATSLTIRARGDLCRGNPTMVTKIDGVQVLSSSVSSTTWSSSYTASKTLAAGSHTINISFTNDYTKSCSRNLYIDKIEFSGTTATTPAPTITFSASPTTVASGATSSLTWSSTNANSCTASGAWSGTKATSGTETTTPINAASTYSLSCTGVGGTTTAPDLVVTVGTTSTKLRWAPPVLSNPTTIILGTGRTESILDPAKDYIINLPSTKKSGPTVISGGRNIILKGGHITVPPGSSGGYCNREALCIRDVTGTLHIEGVLIDNSGGSDFDAINISAPQAIVQIQNVRAEGLTGTVSGNHTDVVQPWGGVKELRIDRLSGTSNYQGLFLQPEPNYGAIGPISIYNTDIAYASSAATSGSNQFVWLANGCTTPASIAMQEVYVVPKPGASLGEAVWPDIYSQNGCPVSVSQNIATWPKLPSITGVVKLGPPPGGSFVPAGVAGLNYTSPGY